MKKSPSRKTAARVNKRILVSIGVGVLIFYAGMVFNEVVNHGSESTTPTVGQATPRPLNRDNVLILLNEARIEAGVIELAEHTTLDASAQDIADKIAASGKCSHDFLRERRAQKDVLAYASENLSCGTSNATEAVQGLLNSPTHRQSLLSKDFDLVGIGINGNNLVVHLLPKAE